MTDKYFEKYLSQSDTFIADFSKDLNLPVGEVYLDSVYQNIYVETFNKTVALYSSGSSIDNLTRPVYSCLEALTNYKKQPDSGNLFFVKSVNEYMNALTLLSWGIALHIDQPAFDQLVAHIDGEGHRDALVDLLIASRQPERQLSQSLYFPKLYRPLYQAVQARSSQQVASFLGGWYTTCLGKTAYHNIHTLHGGDDSGFTGYWAWEVAGLTIALDLDDTPYRQMPYYPADLVAFARRS